MPVRSSISNAVMVPSSLDPDPALAAMVAGVDVGVEALDPVGDELDRPAQQFRQRVSRHFVGVDVDLDAERAADILADHANLGVLQTKVERRNVLHHVRRLGALVDRQPRLRDVPVGDHGTRLQRDAGMPAEHKFRLHHRVGIGKRPIDGADIELALERQIVAQRRVNDRRFRIERGAHVGHRIQLAVFNRDDFRGVFRHRTAGRHDRGNGLSLPAHMVDRDRMLGGGFETLHMRQHADPWRDDRRQFSPRHHRDDARDALCRGRIDGNDAGMRMRRAQEDDMRHPRQFHVADIKPAPLHQPFEIGPRDHLADIGVRPIQQRETVWRRAHGARPMRARAVVSIASMMAW